MTDQDLRVLCAALGFTAALADGDEDVDGQSNRALYLARLIESFCHHAVPGIGATASEDDRQSDAEIERLITALDTRGEVDMDKDRRGLRRLHLRLCQRYNDYADADMLADRALELLDAEIARRHARGS